MHFLRKTSHHAVVTTHTRTRELVMSVSGMRTCSAAAFLASLCSVPRARTMCVCMGRPTSTSSSHERRRSKGRGGSDGKYAGRQLLLLLFLFTRCFVHVIVAKICSRNSNKVCWKVDQINHD